MPFNDNSTARFHCVSIPSNMIASRAPPGDRSLCSRTMHARLWRWRVPIGAATAAVAGGCVTRMLLTPKPEPNRSDEASRARLAVSRQAPKVVRVAYRDAEGRAHMARIDERRLHLETQRQLAALEASRPALQAEARAAANAQLDEVFARLQVRGGLAGANRVGSCQP